MRMILTSRDFENENSKACIMSNLPLPLPECKILFIPNENATLGRIRSGRYHKRMESHGFQMDNIFVFNHYEPEKYFNLGIDAIFIGGGNTFSQMAKIKKCGFDFAIIDYVKNGVLYIGGSAGTHIASKNIRHVLPFDRNKNELTDFTGLGLFDGIVFCHYTDERKRYYDEAVAENKYKVYRIKDDQAIAVNS